MPRPDACQRGHPYPANLAIDNRGWKSCRQCRRDSWRRWYRAHYIPAAPDHVAVNRATDGDPPARLTPRERAAVIHRLDAYGYTARQIADRIGCSKRTVHRARGRRTPA
ncbi:helix-turn-helix domain-containing protein [Nocardioides sp. NPDC006273]|uniref:helix-turn-helix domain-containing protein n=1 Tax=Actinomycetes TaxID=1760 RepID=UPI00339FF4B7